jgi:hypothetical protein
LVGEFTGDGVPDYAFLFNPADVVPGPLPSVLDIEDDDRVVARFELGDPDWWHLSTSTGQLAGDGFSDLVFAGAYSDGGAWFGAATFIYHGPFSSDRVIGDTTPGEEPDATLLYAGMEQDVGTSVSLGDTDGDGYDDLLLGAPTDYPHTYPSYTDAVYLFRGPVAGAHDVSEADSIFLDPAGVRGLGLAVDLHGDFNGDGMKDPVLVANDFYLQGGVFVFNGAPPLDVISADSADAILSPYNSYGGPDFATGDHDGDGYDDLVVTGACDWGCCAGAVWIFNGPLPAAFTMDDGHVFIHHSQAYAEFGLTASLEQDLDADGRDDLVAAAPHAWSDGGWTGGAYVHYGPLEGSIDADDADTVYRVWTDGDPLGVWGPTNVAPGGDVNLDGYQDFFSTGCNDRGEALSCDLRTYAIFGGLR